MAGFVLFCTALHIFFFIFRSAREKEAASKGWDLQNEKESTSRRGSNWFSRFAFTPCMNNYSMSSGHGAATLFRQRTFLWTGLLTPQCLKGCIAYYLYRRLKYIWWRGMLWHDGASKTSEYIVYSAYLSAWWWPGSGNDSIIWWTKCDGFWVSCTLSFEPGFLPLYVPHDRYGAEILWVD